MDLDMRALTEKEDKYTFSNSMQISMQCGLIGHLRADMDSDGNGFFSRWEDYRKELKTDEFKDEFDIAGIKMKQSLVLFRRKLKLFAPFSKCMMKDTAWIRLNLILKKKALKPPTAKHSGAKRT